ncbi:alpha/beta fold hydrolase [Myxococcus xanthus]|uniref:alpha/beta fold hydrolase n=1 Tax=Myxococcus xanthus TaxID=34 RepID=UPI001F2E7305|nr:hypothetical protein [Myxococcus xanthus]
MSERIIESGDIRLCTEHFGREGDAPVLMLMGAASSMMGWPDGLMDQLARTGRFVIRYDHRDTGRSSHGCAWAVRGGRSTRPGCGREQYRTTGARSRLHVH